MSQEKFVCALDLHRLSIERKFPPPSPSPSIEPTGTFARAIMVESPGYTARRSIHCAVSIAVHFCAVLALLAIPLLLPGKPLAVAFNVSEFVTVPLPPPKNPPGFQPHVAYGRDNRLFSSVKLTAPIFHRHDHSFAAVTLPPDELFETVPFGTSGALGDVINGIAHEATSSLVVPVSPESAVSVPVGGDVKPSRLLTSITLAYPELAKAARVFGRVVILAVIDERGQVTNVRAISGPILLTSAAIDAVSHERFRPMLLNGLPTPCNLMVRVSFRLHSSLSE